ncbi:hypothetical protein EPN44_13135 [bacterium]|nr:MAG: hypothetical protein EPN44_13135 [bacterium]
MRWTAKESIMGCYYHDAVPAAGACSGCHQPLCSTCLSEGPLCGSCRLQQRLERESEPRLFGARRRSEAPPPPTGQAATAIIGTPEGRALAAAGYIPFLWPTALLALVTSHGRDHYVRKQSLQALGFNFGMGAIWIALHLMAAVPLLGWTLWGTLPFVLPIWLIAGIVFGIKTWNGDDVRVPIVSDYVDRLVHA